MPSASAVVVDTDVVSYLFKNDSRAEAYRLHLTGRLLMVSFMTVAELDRWALERDGGEARRTRMELYLRNFVAHRSWAPMIHVVSQELDPSLSGWPPRILGPVHQPDQFSGCSTMLLVRVFGLPKRF